MPLPPVYTQSPIAIEFRLLAYLPASRWDKLSVLSEAFMRQRFKTTRTQVFSALGRLQRAGLIEKKTMPHHMGMNGQTYRKYCTAYRLTEEGRKQAILIKQQNPSINASWHY